MVLNEFFHFSPNGPKKGKERNASQFWKVKLQRDSGFLPCLIIVKSDTHAVVSNSIHIILRRRYPWAPAVEINGESHVSPNCTYNYVMVPES